MLKISFEKTLTAHELADCFVEADDMQQGMFLDWLGFSISQKMPGAKWDFQCRYIVDRWDNNEAKRETLRCLETLVDHIRDSIK